jgi:hypothetical protein
MYASEIMSLKEAPAPIAALAFTPYLRTQKG